MAYRVNESINIALKPHGGESSAYRALPRGAARALPRRGIALRAPTRKAPASRYRAAHRGARALIGVGVVMARRRVKRRKSIKWHGVMKLAVSWRHQRGENISKISASIIISGVAA
jgi:hypothetical protein